MCMAFSMSTLHRALGMYGRDLSTLVPLERPCSCSMGRKGNLSPRPKSTRFCGEAKFVGFAPPRPVLTSNRSNFAWSPANGTGLRVGTICLERIEVLGQHELAPSCNPAGGCAPATAGCSFWPHLRRTRARSMKPTGQGRRSIPILERQANQAP